MEFLEFDTSLVAGNSQIYGGFCGMTKWFCKASARKESLQLEPQVAAPAKIELKQSIKR